MLMLREVLIEGGAWRKVADGCAGLTDPEQTYSPWSSLSMLRGENIKVDS